MSQSAAWNPALYQSGHSFVWEYGRDLVRLLAPQPGERILDVGCGTGQLTAEIAQAGAKVIGIDSSASMIEQARSNFPDIDFEIAEATALPYEQEFDAVFSNAVLHWVQDADRAASGIARALKPGGRFVAEFGGKGNVEALLDAAFHALADLGVPEEARRNPWYYPSIGEYAALLERHRLEVAFAALFDRPTPLEKGKSALSDWLTMFCGRLTASLSKDQEPEFQRLVAEYAAPHLLRDGQWVMDYRRLRVVAVRRSPAS